MDARIPLASLGALLVLQELLKRDDCVVPAAAALAAIVITTPPGAGLEEAVGTAVVYSELLPLLVRLMRLPSTPVVEHCTFVVRKVSSVG